MGISGPTPQERRKPQREKCAGFKRYTAKRPPRCGCVACAKKWTEAQRANLPVDPADVDRVMGLVRAELLRAVKLHGPMRSVHEGYGVIEEERHELFLEMIANDKAAAKVEAIQLSAMAARLVLDVLGG